MAPPVTARTTPTGYMLPEGHRATIAFSKKPAVQFWEMTTRPAGLSVVEIITTTQFNNRYHTSRAGHLIKVKDITGQAAYDPDFLTDIIGMLGDDVGAGVTVHNPDNSAYSYWGFLKDVEFQEFKEGQFPTLNYTVCITNWNTTTRAEEGPLVTPSSGT